MRFYVVEIENCYQCKWCHLPLISESDTERACIFYNSDRRELLGEDGRYSTPDWCPLETKSVVTLKEKP